MSNQYPTWWSLRGYGRHPNLVLIRFFQRRPNLEFWRSTDEDDKFLRRRQAWVRVQTGRGYLNRASILRLQDHVAIFGGNRLAKGGKRVGDEDGENEGPHLGRCNVTSTRRDVGQVSQIRCI